MISRPRLSLATITFLLVGLGCMGIARALHAQSTPATLTSDPLLAEVRGLRADLHQAAGASIRAQLLVARLQLQEQRITVLSGQLVDVRRQLAGKQSEVVPLAEGVRRLEEALLNPSRDPAQQRDLEANLAGRKTALAQLQREVAQLRAQEAELLNHITNEQNRWSDFNTRLDQLERELPAR